MRYLLALTLALPTAALLHAESPPPRYGVAADLKTYPQATPKETLASVLKALTAKRVDYVVAQLADPEFVDRRVKDNGGKPDELLQEAKARLLDDPATVKMFERFLKDGAWGEGEEAATASLKGVTDRKLFFRKRGGRWYLENREKEPAVPRP